jgi:HEAT repeat protein
MKSRVGLVLFLIPACAPAHLSTNTLIKQLQSPRTEVQVQAADMLALRGPDAREALPQLLALFKDVRPSVSDAATRAISAMGEDGVSSFASLLSDREGWVRCRAVDALIPLGPRAASAVAPLAKALADHDFCVSGKAALALGRIGEPAVPALLVAFKSDNPDVRRLASDALAGMGPAVQRRAAETLLPALRDGDEFERGEAAQRLSAMGPAAVTIFLDLLWGKDVDLRHKAVEGLSEVGDSSPAVIDALSGLFRDPERTLRLRAALVLGKLGQRDPQVLNRLRPLLRSPDDTIRRGTLQALGAMRTAAAPVVEDVIAVMNDSKDPLRNDAIETLNEIATPEALQAAEKHTRRDYLDRKAATDKRFSPK